MRYNLTIDDSLAARLEKQAKIQNTTELDLIRQAVVDRFPNELGISSEKFSMLTCKEKRGYRIDVEGRIFFFFGKSDELRQLFNLQGCVEIPKKLEKFLKKWSDDGELHCFPAFHGTFTSIQLPPNDKNEIEYLLCAVPGGVPGNLITYGTLSPQWGDKNKPLREDFIVDGKFLETFFK
jgi:hypothetical protein